jgi:hypothetical protein
MDARSPTLEEVAGALPGSAVESNGMGVVVTLKRDRELFE